MAKKSKDVEVLTKEIAKKFVADPDSVNISKFTEIEDEAAVILAKKFSDGLDIEALSESVQSKLDGCKLLVDYSYYTGEIDLCGLFVTTIGDFRKCEGKSYNLVNDNDVYEVDLADLLSIRSRDQDLIAKLEAEYDGRESLLGCHIIRDRIDYASDYESEEEIEEEHEYVDDIPRQERADPRGTLTNNIGLKLVPIAAGVFQMGDLDSPVHKVRLTKDFYLSMTQVTQAQYKQVMGENPSDFQGDAVAGLDSSEFPVEQVSWDDAVEFCKRLSELPEEKNAGRVYRLPTEAEWEYACRAGSDTHWYFGDDKSKLSAHGWFDENSNSMPYPVALKEPNDWGLYDMHGNVWEWCSDWMGDYPEEAVTDDPVGPELGSDRVIRGGSWADMAWITTSATRSQTAPSNRCKDTGFRVAMSSSGIHG